MDDHTASELDQLTVTTQADLQRMWELLMEPLGFRSTSLWFTFLGPDDRPTRFIVEISESDEVPSEREVAGLFDLVRHLVEEDGGDVSVAFLITRPGRAGTIDFDRALSQRLLDGARSARLPMHPIHVADDLAVRAISPDDLAA